MTADDLQIAGLSATIDRYSCFGEKGMNRWALTFGMLWLAFTLVVQDDAPPAFGGGRDQAQVFTRIDTVNPMDQVKAFLSKANITLSGDQERTLKPAVEAALKEAQ